MPDHLLQRMQLSTRNLHDTGMPIQLYVGNPARDHLSFSVASRQKQLVRRSHRWPTCWQTRAYELIRQLVGFCLTGSRTSSVQKTLGSGCRDEKFRRVRGRSGSRSLVSHWCFLCNSVSFFVDILVTSTERELWCL